MEGATPSRFSFIVEGDVVGRVSDSFNQDKLSESKHVHIVPSGQPSELSNLSQEFRTQGARLVELRHPEQFVVVCCVWHDIGMLFDLIV